MRDDAIVMYCSGLTRAEIRSHRRYRPLNEEHVKGYR